MVSTPYSTLLGLRGPLPTWLNTEDAERVQSYDLYEDIYWGNPAAFTLVQRGTEGNPIYVPSGRIIVNTMNRYTGRNWSPAILAVSGNEAAEEAAALAFRGLFRRERFQAIYASTKRSGITKGDWCFHITASLDKAAGRRITLRSLDPGMYFPIVDPRDTDRILGVDIAEQVNIGDRVLVKRQRYLRSIHPSRGGVDGGQISYQVDHLETQDWQNEDEQTFVAVVDDDQPQTLFPPGIPAIPIYHIRHKEEQGNPFGSSEMRGIERLMAAVNQAATDEDLALVLTGLGLYTTDAGSPVDDSGTVVPWDIGPGAVVEVGSGRTFSRIPGINSVTPVQDHLRYLHEQMGRVSGASDVAQGVVDVSVAESGIALQLRMSPITQEAEENEIGISATMDQFLNDLRAWFAAYEGVNFDTVEFESVFGPKLPTDVAARVAQLDSMYNALPPLITGDYYRAEMRDLGFPLLPLDMGEQLSAEEDALGARLDAEAGIDPETGELINSADANTQV